MTDSPEALLLQHLRRALNHLYDPGDLRSSPLLAMLDLEQTGDKAVALRRILTQAIESLKPDKATPPEATSWRIHRALSSRFVEQSPQVEVATDLGLGIRQYRRQEALALAVLLDHLRARYGLVPNAGQLATLARRGRGPVADSSTSSWEQELAWLQETVPSEPLDVAEMLRAVLKVASPMAQTLHVHVRCSVPPDLPRATGQLTTLRQALLNILTVALRSVPGGGVQIEVEVRRWEIGIQITPVGLQAVAAPKSDEDSESLAMAWQLAGLLGASLQVMPGEGGGHPFTARLSLPVAEQVPVLVIDGNVGTLQLLQRYLTGTRYRFIGVSDPDQVLAQESTPQIIVLDVMLPDVDGWEVLGRLREHPHTHGVPIIVCTILPQEHLALSLGAAAFLRKPVSRSAFLAALDRQVGSQERGN